jgi:hypothetical protein
MVHPKIAHLDPKIRKRIRFSNFAFLFFWCISLALITSHAPFGLVFWTSILGGYFALRDWKIILKLRKDINAHPDPDVQDLIDEKIDITEYRLRKERIANVTKDK